MKISNIEKSVNELEKIIKISDNIFPLKRIMPSVLIVTGITLVYFQIL